MNRQEAQELLPWFVAGTLNEQEARAVQAFIDSGEISNTELDELNMFAVAVDEQTANEPEYNPAILKNAMAQLDATPQEAADEPLVVGEAKPKGGGLFAALLDRLQWSQTPNMAKLALGAQFAAVLALAIAVAMPGGQDMGGAYYDVVSGTAPTLAADLNIAFAPDASEAAVRELLLELDAQIVAGPNSLGMYSIALPADVDLAQTQTALSANELVTYAQPAANQ